MASTGSTVQTQDASWSRDAVSVRTVARQVVLSSWESSAVTLESYAKAVIDYANGSEERHRRAGIQRRLLLLQDAWGPLLKASLENWLTKPVCDAVMGIGRDHLDLSRNPAKNIWTELAIVYKAPPKRSTPANPDEGEKYNKLLEGTQFDLFWQLVEVTLQACNEVLVWPDVIERDGQKHIKHRMATGANAVIVTTEDDPTEIECILIVDEYRDLSGEDHAKYRLWTDRWHAEFERGDDGELQRTDIVTEAAPEDDNSAANPYRTLPQWLVRLYPRGDAVWDATSGEDLVDLTIHGGIERALYRYQQKMGGFKQLVASGAAIEDMPQQLLDPGALGQVVGSDVHVQLIDWQTDLKSRLECMMTDELAAAASRGINPERYKKTASYQTGFGAKLSERGLQETRTRTSSILRLAEQKYYRALCVVAKTHGLEDVPDENETLLVEHAPMAYPEDPKAQLEMEAQEMAMGLESPVTLLQRRHPEWTEEECRDAIKARMADIAEFNEMKARFNIPADPTNESRTAEQNGAAGPAVRDGKPRPGMMPPGQDRAPVQ